MLEKPQRGGSGMEREPYNDRLLRHGWRSWLTLYAVAWGTYRGRMDRFVAWVACSTLT